MEEKLSSWRDALYTSTVSSPRLFRDHVDVVAHSAAAHGRPVLHFQDNRNRFDSTFCNLRLDKFAFSKEDEHESTMLPHE